MGPDTARVEAFSDAVFAIAMTLLVLDLKAPAGAAGSAELARELARQWPAYLAFVTSFATILIMWINHHRMFALVGRTDDRLLLLNGLLLLGVTLVPFPTALVATYLARDGERMAAILYSGLFAAIAVGYNLLWRSAAGTRRLIRPEADHESVKQLLDAYRYGPLWYCIALVLAVVNVTASLLVNLGLAIFFALPRERARTTCSD